MRPGVVIEIAVGRPDDWLREKLEAFVWVLDRNLRNSGRGQAEGKMAAGVLRVRAVGIPLAEAREYVDAFAASMRRHQRQLIAHVRREEAP